MAIYYYLMSSLPVLNVDGDAPFTYESFLSQCENCVSAKTYKALCDLTSSPKAGRLLKEWAEFNTLLNDELKYQRSTKLGRPCSAPYNRDSDVISAVNAAMSAANPLISEQILLALEFKKIDSMLGLHSYDEYSLFGYAIKLKLLARQNIFDHNEGKNEFNKLFSELQQQILSI